MGDKNSQSSVVCKMFKIPFFSSSSEDLDDIHLARHMTLVKKVPEFLEVKSGKAYVFEFAELERDINRLFGTILELYFPKCAPKVCAPIRHTDWQQISEISSSKMHFRRFFDQYCACWVHILARALFTK